MKTIYPSSLTKAEYEEILVSEYKDKYPQFSKQQIEFPIKKIIGTVDYAIKEYTSTDLVLLRIDLMKEMVIDRDFEDKGKEVPDFMYNITDFFTGEETMIRVRAKSHKTEFPENYREEYLCFISEVTKQIVSDICKATEDKIPHVAKIEYRRWIGSENILQNPTEISWQETIRSGNDNKKTVSWAEKYEKKITSTQNRPGNQQE